MTNFMLLWKTMATANEYQREGRKKTYGLRRDKIKGKKVITFYPLNIILISSTQ